jgi:hypothetical protein
MKMLLETICSVKIYILLEFANFKEGKIIQFSEEESVLKI